MNLKDYARIDMFFNYNENKIIIIEINTLPAMSPSTVLYSQALLEKNIKTPLGFIEKIISN